MKTEHRIIIVLVVLINGFVLLNYYFDKEELIIEDNLSDNEYSFSINSSSWKEVSSLIVLSNVSSKAIVKLTNDGENYRDGNITHWNITLDKSCRQYYCEDICFTCEV